MNDVLLIKKCLKVSSCCDFFKRTTCAFMFSQMARATFWVKYATSTHRVMQNMLPFLLHRPSSSNIACILTETLSFSRCSAAGG